MKLNEINSNRLEDLWKSLYDISMGADAHYRDTWDFSDSALQVGIIRCHDITFVLEN